MAVTDQREGEQLERVLVDGHVLMADPDVMQRIHKRKGLAVITDAVLRKLEGFAKAEGPQQDKARFIVRELRSNSAMRMRGVPPGGGLQEHDTLVRRAFLETPVYVLERPLYRSRTAERDGLIEVAQDYGMVLLTRDDGLRAAAQAAGVQAVLWTGPPRAKVTPTRSASPAAPPPTPAGPPPVRPFAVCHEPIREADARMAVSQLPASGDAVRLADGASVLLGKQISAGGEGIIYALPGDLQVCKIYHRDKLTQLKKRKIELMTTRRIERPGICWPTQTVHNGAGEFVGYVMPRANGQTMQSTMFVKPRLLQVFPDWTRADLVNVAGTFIDHVDFLHRHNILIGDINPMNLLVTADSTAVWMVDTDSFQIEAFPCPVGTVNFTAPEIQGQNYPDFLRTIDHELFAVATMIFMILFPGKAPYAQQGGGSPGENIKSRNFPYRYYRDAGQPAPQVSGEDAPLGSWQYIWSHLPNPMRQAFYDTFRENRRSSVKQWTDLLMAYRDRLQQKSLSDEMFPLSFPIRDPVQMPCGVCAKPFTNSKRFVEKLAKEGRVPWCSSCQHRKRLERLAVDSRRATRAVPAAPTPRSQPVYTSSGWRPQAHVPPARPTPPPPRPSSTTSSRTTYRPAPSPAPSLFDAVGRLLSQLFK